MSIKDEIVIPSDERNVEIKARVGSDEEFQRRVQVARELTKSTGELLVQKDVFFNILDDSKGGRFKLRYLQPPTPSQLIYYVRPNKTGPKLSTFNRVDVDDPALLEKILAQSNGVKGTLEKERYLFLHDQTRIHMDKVKHLGNFMEFEVCLRPDQTVEEGQKVADELMKVFNIRDEDLMTGAYFDELN
ncbi:uncharacterized protein LOC126758029 [Bactrocera neohumeralis]|uniref:uncharacterized protein LOC120774735 n=1 Tax=Bactrocera tryoni TaxID=59916 RepID=UPI001A99980B|nr:uncharacterized protein LOC120774735 [Bactrocera tryoni]XP_050327970.1 uncharacterized protein LOC126758029 [Bactrocera neohumeralis]